MVRRPEICLAAFGISAIATARVPDRPSGIGCEIDAAMRLPAGVRPLPSTPVATCPLAAAWVLFERNTLQPEALRHLGAAVAPSGTWAPMPAAT